MGAGGGNAGSEGRRRSGVLGTVRACPGRFADVRAVVGRNKQPKHTRASDTRTRMPNAAVVASSRARAAAAARNTCRALVPADMFPTMSPEMKIAYEMLQGMQTKPCDHCGNAVPMQAFMGCGTHPACEECMQDPSIQIRKPNGCCTVRGCNLPVPDQYIAITALTEARSNAAECLHKMVFALQRDEMRDPAAAAAAAEDGSQRGEDSDEDSDDEAGGGKRKRGKMSAEKVAAMLAKRRATMAAKKEAAAAELAAGQRAIVHLAAAKVEIAQLEDRVGLLQTALRLAEAPVEYGNDDALDAVMEIVTAAEVQK